MVKPVQSEYSKKLRDPRWQKKRLEIMKRDDFSCIKCGDNESPLNVHHCYYKKGNEPWEYDDSSLVTLCENCHKEEENCWQEKMLLIEELSKKGMLSEGFETLSTALLEGDKGRFSEYDIATIASLFLNESLRSVVFEISNDPYLWNDVQELIANRREGK